MRGGWEVGVIWMVLLGLCLQRPHWSKDLSGGREAAPDVQVGEPSTGHRVPTLRKRLLGLPDGSEKPVGSAHGGLLTGVADRTRT